MCRLLLSQPSECLYHGQDQIPSPMDQPARYDGAAGTFFCQPAQQPPAEPGDYRDYRCFQRRGNQEKHGSVEQPEQRSLNKVPHSETKPDNQTFPQKATEQDFFRKTGLDNPE